MFVIVRAVVGLTSIRRGFKFIRQGRGPFLPGEVSLFRESYCKSECLRLPWFGKHRSFIIGRWPEQWRKGGDTLTLRLLMPGQDSPPRDPHRQNPAPRPACPIVPARQTGRNRRAVVSRQENAHSYWETRKHRGRE